MDIEKLRDAIHDCIDDYYHIGKADEIISLPEMQELLHPVERVCEWAVDRDGNFITSCGKRNIMPGNYCLS